MQNGRDAKKAQNISKLSCQSTKQSTKQYVTEPWDVAIECHWLGSQKHYLLIWYWKALSLASWDISASYFSCRPRIREISSLHSSRSCESQWKRHETSASISAKNQAVSLGELILSAAEIRESEWEFGQKNSSYMISRWCRWIRYCKTEGVPKGSRLSSSLEICAISASCSSWVFWKSVARALEWSNSCMFGSLTRLGHFWELRKAFAHVHDNVRSCIYNRRSAKQCDRAAVDFAIVYQGISWYIIIRYWYCWPARHIGFSGFGMCQKVPKRNL